MRFKISPTTETNIRSLLVFSAILTLTGFLASFVTAGIGIYFIIGIVAAMTLTGLWFSKEIALKAMQADKVEPNTMSEGFDLNEIIHGLCSDPQINLSSCPEAYIIDSPKLNAFAIGRSKNKAAVIITTSLLQEIVKRADGDREKAQRWIEAIYCHELGHVVHHDILATSAIGMISTSLTILSRALYVQRRIQKQKQKQQQQTSLARHIMEYAIFYWLIPFTGTLLTLCLSRTREYAADDMAKKCGRGNDLADVFEQVFKPFYCKDTQDRASQTGDSPLEHLNAMLCLNSNPAADQERVECLKDKKIGWLKWGYLQYKDWVSTHPPIDDRIERLRSQSTRASCS